MSYNPQNPNGQAAMANSQPVALASDQSAISVNNQDGLGNDISSLSADGTMNGLASSLVATHYVSSTANSSAVQLAVGATFTGAIETCFNQQAISLLLTTDQNGTLTIKQYIDSGGTRVISTWVMSISAGVPYSRAFVANGNYVNVTFQNNGSATTTTFRLDTAYGILPSVTNLGNGPVSLNEVNGTVIASNTGVSDAGTQRNVLTNDYNSTVKSKMVDSAGVITANVSQASSFGSGLSALAVNINAQQKATYLVPINRLVNAALTANTTAKQVSIEHAANSTKTLKLKRIHLGALNTTAIAGDFRVFIDYGTAASTAGTVLTAQPTSGAFVASEAVVKTLPTIVATTTKFVSYVGSVAATANTSINGVMVYEWLPGTDSMPLVLRAGVLESLVIGIQSYGANVYHVTGFIEFTEE